MNTFFIKAFVVMMLSVFPMIFAFLGAYALPIALISWYIAYRILLSLITEAEKEERRAAGQAAHRLRVCVEKTHSYYSK